MSPAKLDAYAYVKRLQLNRASLLTTGTATLVAAYIVWLSFSLLDLHHAVHANGMRMRSFAADVHSAIALHSDKIRATSENHSNNFTGWEFSLALAEAKVVRMQKVEAVLSEAMKEADAMLKSRPKIVGTADELSSTVAQAQSAFHRLDELQAKLEKEQQELVALRDEYRHQKARAEEVLNAVQRAAKEMQ